MADDKAWGLFRLHVGAILGQNFAMYGLADGIPAQEIEYEAKRLIAALKDSEKKAETKC